MMLGSRIVLNEFDDGGNSTRMKNNMAAIVAEESNLGFLGLSGALRVDAALDFADQSRIPLIALASGYSKLLSPFRSDVVNLRIPNADEAALAVKFFSTHHLLNEISVVRMADDLESLDFLTGVKKALASLRLSIQTQVIVSNTAKDLTQGKQNANTAVESITTEPQGLILLTGNTVWDTVGLILKAKERWPNVYIGVIGAFSIAETILTELADQPAVNRKNLYFSKFLPRVSSGFKTIRQFSLTQSWIF